MMQKLRTKGVIDMGDNAEIAYVFHDFEFSPGGLLEKSRYSYKQTIL